MAEFTHIKMPEEFRTEDPGKLFQRCEVCESKLLHDDQVYMIEKYFRGNELQFEYAICMECLQKLEDDMSYPSRNMRDFWQRKYLRIAERFERLSKKSLSDVLPWINTCAVTGKHRRELDEYNLVALCEGKRLLMCGFPIMLSERAMEQYRELMSKETREEWDRFARDVLNYTPETVHDLDDDSG